MWSRLGVGLAVLLYLNILQNIQGLVWVSEDDQIPSLVSLGHPITGDDSLFHVENRLHR